MSKPIENNDNAKEFWENLSDASTLDAATKQSLVQVAGVVAYLADGNTPQNIDIREIEISGTFEYDGDNLGTPIDTLTESALDYWESFNGYFLVKLEFGGGWSLYHSSEPQSWSADETADIADAVFTPNGLTTGVPTLAVTVIEPKTVGEFAKNGNGLTWQNTGNNTSPNWVAMVNQTTENTWTQGQTFNGTITQEGGFVAGAGATFYYDPAAQTAALAALGAARGIEIKTGNFTAVRGGRYIVEGTATVTDPSGSNVIGDSYEVWIGSGAATLGGVAYSASRFSIRRRCSVAGSPGTWVTPSPFLTDALDFASGAKSATLTNLGGGAVGVPLFQTATRAAALAAIATILTPSGNTSTASTTPTNITGWSYEAVANQTYLIVLIPQVSIPASGGGYEISSTSPAIAGPPSQSPASGFYTSLGTFSGNTIATSSTAMRWLRAVNSQTPSGQAGAAFSIGTITCTSSGTVQFQWALANASGSSSVLLLTSKLMLLPI